MTHATLPETDTDTDTETDSPAPEHHGQAHPIRLYLLCWGLLFVLSAASYAVAVVVDPTVEMLFACAAWHAQDVAQRQLVVVLDHGDVLAVAARRDPTV